MNGLKRINEAISLVRRMRPLYAVPLLTMPYKADSDVPLMGTDGRTIFYNEEGCANTPLVELVFALMHEILHKWGLHPRRMKEVGAENHELCNIAADLAVNSLLVEQGETLPATFGALMPGQGDYAHLPTGRSFEWYYEKLKTERDEGQNDDNDGQSDVDENGGQDSQQEPGNTGSGGDSDGDGGTDGGDTGSDSADGDAGDGKGDGGEGASKSPVLGDSAEGRSRVGESNKSGGKGLFCNDLREPPLDGTPQGEVEVLAEVQAALNSPEAFSDTRSAGVVRRLVGDTYAGPRVDWKLRLRSYLTAASTKRKRSYSREARRTSQFILPAYRKDKTLCRTAVVIDTSGSMDGPLLERVLAECLAVVSSFDGAELTAVMCDTDVRATMKLRTPADIGELRDSLLGGGGTDMGPAFGWALRDGAQLIVCLSDLFMRFPPRPPIPVVWGNLRGYSRTVPYGEVLDVWE